jgi:hypothetical protein
METEIYSDYKKDTFNQEKIKELDELIELSEKISDKINALTKRRNLMFLLSVLYCILIYTFLVYLYINFNDEQYKTFLENGFMISALTISILGLGLSYLINERIKANREIENEKIILDRLFEMITNLKETTDLGTVSKAIYEMRLSRIQFSYKTKR